MKWQSLLKCRFCCLTSEDNLERSGSGVGPCCCSPALRQSPDAPGFADLIDCSASEPAANLMIPNCLQFLLGAHCKPFFLCLAPIASSLIHCRPQIASTQCSLPSFSLLDLQFSQTSKLVAAQFPMSFSKIEFFASF
ncbi:hypothetical protein GOP47_0010876 [Adiantum capillus-veneris]|uniref:Uncharacterized protein n=1 Tax=Adiantum capillus-veneris TaxID=13818 RepID=A0A9D4UW49_ADICA|nr:hypothetical protein GOP47_0010876 [Adiantum capillus-veneris]